MPSYEPEPFRPVNRRRRFLIALLAIATAAFVVWAMTRKSGMVEGEVRKAALHPADVAACTQGQTVGCVGSMTSVIAAPAAAPASAASR